MTLPTAVKDLEIAPLTFDERVALKARNGRPVDPAYAELIRAFHWGEFQPTWWAWHGVETAFRLAISARQDRELALAEAAPAQKQAAPKKPRKAATKRKGG